ncbi:hypothetical protein DRB96_40400 [Streptomyces sp. ICC1]|nr:hypothetical protein DRB89_39970 [Streptomyces sp. ICC4]AWZ17348.1 hypothetical protein DRB96_40400 [Streptomyces sp. ICC1]
MFTPMASATWTWVVCCRLRTSARRCARTTAIISAAPRSISSCSAGEKVNSSTRSSQRATFGVRSGVGITGVLLLLFQVILVRRLGPGDSRNRGTGGSGPVTRSRTGSLGRA